MNGRSKHDEWVLRHGELCDRSKEDFVNHHREKYEGRMPIWVAIELWDFGLLSKFFSGMQSRDQRKIALAYGLRDDRLLPNWLHNFSFVRNVVAHHARLWNRTNPTLLRLPAPEAAPLLHKLNETAGSPGKLFCTLTCMRFLIRTIHPESKWHVQLKHVIGRFPASKHLSLDAAGFPEDWQDWPIWRDPT